MAKKTILKVVLLAVLMWLVGSMALAYSFISVVMPIPQSIASIPYVGSGRTDETNVTKMVAAAELNQPYLPVVKALIGDAPKTNIEAPKQTPPTTKEDLNRALYSGYQATQIARRNRDVWVWVTPAGWGGKVAFDWGNETAGKGYTTGYDDGVYSWTVAAFHGDIVAMASTRGLDPGRRYAAKVQQELQNMVDMAGAGLCPLDKDENPALSAENKWLSNPYLAGDKYSQPTATTTVTASPKVQVKVFSMPDIVPPTPLMVDVAQSIAAEPKPELATKNMPPQPSDTPPSLPERPVPPSLTKQIGIYVPQEHGPGCGYAFTGETQPSLHENPKIWKSYLQQNDAAYAAAQSELDAIGEDYVKRYDEYQDKLTDWEHASVVWREWVNEVFQTKKEWALLTPVM